MSDAEKIASEVIQEFALGSSWSLPVLHKHLVEALLAAEARGYAAAREQAAKVAQEFRPTIDATRARHAEDVAVAIRKMEPNT